MRILYLCSTDLTAENSSPGSVRHVMEVSENFVRLGHQVHMIAPGFGHYPHQTEINITYLPLINCRILRTLIPELLAPFLLLWKFIFWQPVIVYWRQTHLTPFPPIICRLFKIPIITEINGLTIDEIDSDEISAMRKWVILSWEAFNYRHSRHLICVAPQIRKRIIDHYHLEPKKVSVILNGVNAELMPLLDTGEAKQEIGIDKEIPVVGFVGHLFPWDGVEYLIQAAPIVIEKNPNIRFLIIGQGKWGEHLPELAKEKGVDASFIFTGRIPWEKLYIYINSFDVATAPYSQAINSKSGRSSLKILEYFACQKPVVASQTDAIPEIVDIREREFGITLPPENPKALAEAINELLSDAGKRRSMGQGARKYVEKERSWKIVAEQIIKEMRQILDIQKSR